MKRQHTYGVLVAVLCALALVIALPRIVPSRMAGHSGLEPRAQEVVFLGFTGVPWSNINEEDTPYLYAFASQAAIANNVVKTASDPSCPNAAWLTLNAGKRARDVMAAGCGSTIDLTQGSSDQTRKFNELVKANSDLPAPPQIGSLAKVLESADVRTVAVGAGAGLALADAHGSIAARAIPLTYEAGIAQAPGIAIEQALKALDSGADMAQDAAKEWRTNTNHKAGMKQPTDTGHSEDIEHGDGAQHSEALTQTTDTRDASSAERGVVIVDLGVVRSSEYPLGQSYKVPGRVKSAYASPRNDTSETADQVRELDQAFGDALRVVPSHALVIAASLSEADPLTSRLQFFAVRSAQSHAVISASPLLSPDESESAESSENTENTENSENIESAASSEGIANAMSGAFDPGFFSMTGGTIVAPSTRSTTLVQSTDIVPTIFSALGINSDSDSVISESFMGTPVTIDHTYTSSENHAGTVTSANEDPGFTDARIFELVDQQNRALATYSSVGWYMTILAAAGILLVPALALAYKRPWRKTAVLYGGLWLAAFPVTALLVNAMPWWRLPGARAVLLMSIVLGAAVVSAVIGTSSRLWHKRLRIKGTSGARIATVGLSAGGVLSTITLAAFIIDASFGSPLHSTSVLGSQQPQVGLRFYGFGNYAHIVIALSALFTALWLAWRITERRKSGGRALTAAILIGCTILYASASTVIGADFGGTLGIIVSFVILGFAIYRKQMHMRNVCIAAACGVVAMVALALLDWLRSPGQRTHIGNFVQKVIDGGLFDVLGGKISAFLGTATPVAWVGTLGEIFFALWIAYRVVRYWDSHEDAHAIDPYAVYARYYFIPLYWKSALAALVLIVISTLINDSGILIPFAGVMFMMPLWLVARS